MSSTKPAINVYCDESCHLEGDHSNAMVLGAITCYADDVPVISKQIRALKVEHGLASNFEVKWTKVSPARLDFYMALLELFIGNDRLTLRSLVVPDKSILDHANFAQSHDDWYYKMYYTMLNPIFSRNSEYRVYIDIKDTRGASKTRKLHEVLCNSRWDFDRDCIVRVQQIRSHESELLQLADLLIGAITYANRGLSTSTAKTSIINRLKEQFGDRALTATSLLAARKLNLLLWRPRGMVA